MTKKELIKLLKNHGQVDLYIKIADVIMIIEKFWGGAQLMTNMDKKKRKLKV